MQKKLYGSAQKMFDHPSPPPPKQKFCGRRWSHWVEDILQFMTRRVNFITIRRSLDFAFTRIMKFFVQKKKKLPFLSSHLSSYSSMLSIVLFELIYRLFCSSGSHLCDSSGCLRKEHLESNKQPQPVSILFRGLMRWLVYIHYNPKPITKTEYRFSLI
jgi:hypothetical protein